MANLLIVDDEADIREGMRQLLIAHGHSVIEAGNGAAGLAQLAQNRVDLVLMDIVMPGKEGIETIMEIRRLWPNMKIVAMSGRPRKDIFLDVASKLGADAILHKPFQPGALSKTVEGVLAR